MMTVHVTSFSSQKGRNWTILSAAYRIDNVNGYEGTVRKNEKENDCRHDERDDGHIYSASDSTSNAPQTAEKLDITRISAIKPAKDSDYD